MKICKKHFTLFELLISIGLLVVVAVVLVQMLALTSDYWHHSNEQGDVYMDNKVLFNMLSDELGNIVYDYSNASVADSNHAPLFIGEFTAGSSGMIKVEGDSLDKGRTICFVTHTRRDSDTENSDICKVAYVYYPPLQETSGGYSNLDDDKVPCEKNGVIVRMILDEEASTSFKSGQSMGDYFKFDLANAKQVIEGVIDFQLYAYKMKSDTDGETLEAADSPDSQAGLKNVRAVQVVITMLPPNRCKEFRTDFQDRSDDEQREFLHKYARTFSRTFWINQMNAAN